MIIVVMGVDGSGKTTVGTLLAEAMGCHFYDGDDFQPPENVVKIENGIPLDDVDSRPWLASLRNLIENHIQHECQAVIACSALKKEYRAQLADGLDGVEFVYLNGTYDTIWSRLRRRRNPDLKQTILQNQFDMLETPARGMTIDIQGEPPEIVNKIVTKLNISSTLLM